MLATSKTTVDELQHVHELTRTKAILTAHGTASSTAQHKTTVSLLEA